MKTLLLTLAFNFSCQLLYCQFVNITEQVGEHYTATGTFFGSGLSFYDFNGDGWDDLSIGLGSETPQFFENENGTFVPASFDIPTAGNGHIVMMLWADYDNDGDNDLLITKNPGPVELWRNDGTDGFLNVADSAGLEEGSYIYSGAAFADYNHDGCLDLYIAKFYYHTFVEGEQYQNILYKSNCDGTFSTVTLSAGVDIVPSFTFQPVFFDYNKDGWEDLYLINEFMEMPNNLFHNNGDGTFTEVSESTGAGIYIDAMTSTAGDFNNDLLLDIFVTNRTTSGGNHLLVDQGNNTYLNEAPQLGFGTNYQSWGAVWLDYNNNGWQDIFVSIPQVGNSGEDGNAFYVNHYGENFTNERDFLGFSEDFSKTYVCARGDLNNDGYYDLAHSSRTDTPFQLYENSGGENHYLSVSLEGTVSNRNGIGSWIYCYAGDHQAVHYTLCGENLIGQNSGKQIFGLSEISIVDSIVVEWNRGTREVYYNLDANQHLHLVEGATYTQPFDIVHSGDTALCPGDSLLLNAGEFESYLWSTGDTTQYLSVCEPGTYSVEAWNQFGLSATSFPVIITAHPFTEISTATTHVSCAGAQDGSIEIVFSTGLPNSLTWSNGASETILENLSGGLYNYTCTDQFGCPYAGEVFVNEPPPLLASIITSHVLCYGDSSGMVNTLALGGTPPYSTDWNGLNPDTLSAGNYNATLSDANGCESDLNFEITQPDSLWVSLVINPASNGNNGSVSAEIWGGTPPYQIFWSNGENGSFELDNLSPGEYNLMITDANGCIKTSVFDIDNTTGHQDIEEKAISIFPNPTNNVVIIEGCEASTRIVIYDAFGQIVKQMHPVTCPITIDATGLATGQYIVRIDSLYQSEFIRFVVTR